VDDRDRTHVIRHLGGRVSDFWEIMHQLQALSTSASPRLDVHV
jgi:hypothetical protein